MTRGKIIRDQSAVWGFSLLADGVYQLPASDAAMPGLAEPTPYAFAIGPAPGLAEPADRELDDLLTPGILADLKAALRLARDSADQGPQTIVLTVATGASGPVVSIAGPHAETDEASELLTADDLLRAGVVSGAATVARILAGSDMLTGEAFAERIGARRQTVDNWRKAHSLVALRGSTRGYRYPAWQIADGVVPDHWKATLPKLYALLGNDREVYRFLTMYHPEIGGNRMAKDALLAGQRDEVIAAAEAMAAGDGGA